MIEQAQPDTTTPSDVFVQLAQVNRNANLVLQVPFSPGEVFKEVTIGMKYASELLAFFPESQRMMPEPPFKRGQRSREVYQELLIVFHKIQNILHLSGEEGIFIDTKSIRPDELTSSEVFDIASLVVSELAYLHMRRFKEKHFSFKGYEPGRKFPSHVFQRTAMLKAQLTELTRQVEKQPDWLKNK